MKNYSDRQVLYFDAWYLEHVLDAGTGIDTQVLVMMMMIMMG